MKNSHFKHAYLVIGVVVLTFAILLTAGCTASTTPVPTTAPAAPATAVAVSTSVTSAPSAVATAPTTAAPAATPGASASDSAANAAARGYILIGRPDALTGPIGPFGEGTQWAEDRVLEVVNKDGGIFIQELGKKLPVKTKLLDTTSDTAKAAELAAKLILDDKIDIMEVQMTPDVTNPVDAVSERYGMPTISLATPIEAWATGGPYKWNYHAFLSAEQQMIDQYMNIWDMGQTNKKVGLMLPNDPDGVAFAALFPAKATKRGFTLVDTGRFPMGTKDYSTMINKFKQEGVDIVYALMTPPDFAIAWRQMKQQGFTPKFMTAGKAILFPSDVEALGGDLPNGLTGEMWWSRNHPFKSSITGETPADLCDAFEKQFNKQYAPPIGFKHMGIELTVDVLKRAQSLDKTKLMKAMAETNLDTIFGHIKYNSDHYALTPIVGQQWQKGQKYAWEPKIINNSLSPEIKTNGTLIFPLPK